MRISVLSSAFAFATALAGHMPVQAQASPRSQASSLSTQAQFVCQSLLAAGDKKLAIMDKNNGELTLTDSCAVVDKSPALHGKGKGESEIADPFVTPAGIFNMREYAVDPKDYEGGKVLAFLINKKASYVIHPTYQHLPQQRRDERLASPTPEDNAISFGCINVPTRFYNLTVAFLNANQSIRQTPAGPVAELPKLVILPKNQDLAVTASILGLKP